ncbi:Hypothetical protein A7982_08605 [Minicystis rosea]|nr:Hypothetical protein A7982_08605 [Minicystis rosea]
MEDLTGPTAMRLALGLWELVGSGRCRASTRRRNEHEAEKRPPIHPYEATVHEGAVQASAAALLAGHVRARRGGGARAPAA